MRFSGIIIVCRGGKSVGKVHRAITYHYIVNELYLYIWLNYCTERYMQANFQNTKEKMKNSSIPYIQLKEAKSCFVTNKMNSNHFNDPLWTKNPIGIDISSELLVGVTVGVCFWMKQKTKFYIDHIL